MIFLGEKASKTEAQYLQRLLEVIIKRRKKKKSEKRRIERMTGER